MDACWFFPPAVDAVPCRRVCWVVLEALAVALRRVESYVDLGHGSGGRRRKGWWPRGCGRSRRATQDAGHGVVALARTGSGTLVAKSPPISKSH